MVDLSMIGDGDCEWSPAALKFALDLGTVAASDRELAAMIVHIAMNIVGATAFEEGISANAVIERVIFVADAHVAHLRETCLQ